MSIQLQLASLPDRENVVIELWLGNFQIAEVSNEHGQSQVELYSLPEACVMEISLDELIEALNKAKENLRVLS